MIVLKLGISRKCLFLSFLCWASTGAVMVPWSSSAIYLPDVVSSMFFILFSLPARRRAGMPHHNGTELRVLLLLSSAEPFFSQFMPFNVPWLFFYSFL